MASTKTCAGCGVPIFYQSTWCKKCFAAQLRKPLPHCIDCGRELSSRQCKRCQPCSHKVRRVTHHCITDGCESVVSAPGKTCRACYLAAHRKTTPGNGLNQFSKRRRAVWKPEKPVKVTAPRKMEPQTIRITWCPRCGHEFGRSVYTCIRCLADGVEVETVDKVVFSRYQHVLAESVG